MEALTDLLLTGTELEPWSFALLCGVSFLGSFTTAALGLGGGSLVFATMALFLTPAVLIPVHGVVQLGSNFGRAALMFRHMFSEILPAFLIGTILGAAIGGQLFIALPISLLQLILALFILYITWAPKFKADAPRWKTFFGLGAIATFVTMFVGATGPLVAPFAAAACEKRQQVVATHAMLMSVQHGLKVITFGFLGFAFGPYIPLLVGLLAFGFAGTYIGKHALNMLPEKAFRVGLKIILTVISLRLLYGAATASLA
jgi:uncharacterized membrane protein YfcA